MGHEHDQPPPQVEPHDGHEPDHPAHGLNHRAEPKPSREHEHVPAATPATSRAAQHAVAHPTGHAAHREENFRRRFWVCLVLTVPLLAFTDVVAGLFGLQPPTFPGSQYVPFVLGSIIFFYGGGVFLIGAQDELAMRSPGMMTLVALAITTAYLYSVATEFILRGEPLYWELSTLVVIMLLGHWIEMRAVGTAQGAMAELAKLLPDTAERIVDDRTEEVPVGDLRVGDIVLVRPGARIPADGEVVSGESDVNEAMITGESRLVPKTEGDQVIGGTINGAGSLRVRVTKIGEETMLAGIMRLVEQAQRSRSRTQALADQAAYWLVLIAIGFGAITFFGWLVIGQSTGFALERTVTVLVIACPHALGLAIPLVVAISTTLAAGSGILVRDRLALEEARELDVVVFDKTGTLTLGEFGVVGVTTTPGMSEDQALALAAAAEGDSEHPIAHAIRSAADHAGLRRPTVTQFESIPGQGIRAHVGEHIAQVGGPRLLETLHVFPTSDLQQAAQRHSEEGKTVVFLVVDDQVRAVIALADVIRPESREAVMRLQEMGVRVAMLTGDSEAVARWVAGELGINQYFASVLPGNKADKVSELRKEGQRVAMVGDGVNDAPALLAANVGIAIGAGTQVAIESAGIVLIKSDPRDVVRIINLSHASYNKMVQNLLWATGYNVFALPLAAGLLFPFGLVLIPAVGALLMSISTVIVAINAQLLRRLNLQRV